MVGRQRRVLVLTAFGGCFMANLVGCGGQATAEPKPRFCSPDSSRAGCTTVQIDVEYSLSLHTHCGVGHTYFDGRYWIISPTQPEGRNSITGVMQLVTKSLAHFRGGGRRFAFKPAPSAFAPPPCY